MPSSIASLTRARPLPKSLKTLAYLDSVAERINLRGDGIQETDVTEARNWLGAYDRATIRVRLSECKSFNWLLIVLELAQFTSCCHAGRTS
jgi:hypothetical protein